jgi:3-hydroxyacyl-[acyl-carrier-protein] dehydratase
MEQIQTPVNVHEIIKILPHKWPFLMVDRILTVSDKSIVGIKNVSSGEQHFIGHFPQYPVMPGVLIVESCAQIATLWAYYNFFHGTNKTLDVRLTGIDNFKFRKEVIAGDCLTITATVSNLRDGEKNAIFKCDVEATVDNKIACSGSISGILLK